MNGVGKSGKSFLPGILDSIYSKLMLKMDDNTATILENKVKKGWNGLQTNDPTATWIIEYWNGQSWKLSRVSRIYHGLSIKSAMDFAKGMENTSKSGAITYRIRNKGNGDVLPANIL